MKLLRVLELLSATLPLVFLLKLSSSNKVAALAKEDTMENVNDIDFYNASSAHEGGCGVHVNVDGNVLTTPTTRVLSNNIDGTAHSRGKRFIAFPVGSSFSVSKRLKAFKSVNKHTFLIDNLFFQPPTIYLAIY